HLIPWNPFEPGSTGFPDGFNYGVSLSEFADGDYRINVYAFADAQPANGGAGLECDVTDSSHSLVMSKQGEEVTFNRIGSISGYVFDTEGNPLGGIGVDVEFGGYGTCTDGNGYYTMQEIPFGSYNVVAGRQFCGEHPFMEQMQTNVQVGATNVNFILEQVPVYPSVLHVVPAHPEIHGHEWNPDAFITIYVDEDDDLTNGFLYTATKQVNDEPTWCIAPCFDVSGVPELPNGILPGFVVTMTDGAITRIVHTTSLIWEGTDIVVDTVFGRAEPGTWVEVTSHGPLMGQRLVQADENGFWTADFSVPGVQDFEQDVLDLTPGFHGRSIQFEGSMPDNGTLAYWWIDEPAP
ncbi:MAG: carboxypeptidase regulatory-like domain-containing protein, partial [Chloroflexi bacterium]|nr:carboxypeptidase regulatory-like domain-containing protein [Chloroflexota bacterium]